MTASFPNQTSNYQMTQNLYNIPQQSFSQNPSIGTIGAGLGAIGGGILGYRRNPYISKDSAVTDNFAKKVYEKHLKKLDTDAQAWYKQVKNCLKKLDKIKTVEQLQALKAENPSVIVSSIENITDANLAENVKTIKDSIKSVLNGWYQTAKNTILSAWDASSKKFIKPDAMTEEFFSSINEAKCGMKLKNLGKYAILGSILTAFTLLLAKGIIQNKSSSANIQQ